MEVLWKYRIDESTEIEKYSVKCDYAGGLQRIAVDDVAAGYCISDLNSRGDCMVSKEYIGLEKMSDLQRKKAACPTIQW